MFSYEALDPAYKHSASKARILFSGSGSGPTARDASRQSIMSTVLQGGYLQVRHLERVLPIAVPSEDRHGAQLEEALRVAG